MKDDEKSKEQLISELSVLRQKVAELEVLVGDRQIIEQELKQLKADLESEVAERTAALQGSNEQLVAEVAERHQAEEALRATKDQLEAILEAIPGIVSWISSDLHYLGVNRYLAGTYGLEPNAFVGQDIGFLQSSSQFTEFVRAFFESPSEDTFQEVPATVHGVMRNFLIVMKKYDQGRAAFAVGIDITERHRAEQALREAEEKYRSIFENAIEGIFQTTPDGYYLSANPALARIYGYDSPEELVANLTSVQQQLYVDPKRRSEFIRLLQENDAVVGFESQVYRRDGSLTWIAENAHAVRDTDGNLLYYEGTVEDITERRRAKEALQRINEELEIRVEERTAALKELNRRLVIEIAERQRAEAALRNSEAELRALFAAMTDVITVFDAQGRYLKMVATNSEVHYKPEVDRVGKTVYDVLPLPVANLFYKQIQLALTTEQTVTLEYSLPVSNLIDSEPTDDQPTERWFVANISPLPDNSVIWVARDITQRKQAEEALREAEEKYRGIFENAAEGIFQTTPDGRYISINPALARMYGYDSQEELITHLTDIETQLYVDPNRRAEFAQLLEQYGSVFNFESQFYRKDGSIIWTSENARAVRDEEGQLLYYEGTVEDITKRKLAEEALRESEAKERERSQQLAKALIELQQAQTQLVQSEKMSSLGQLVAGVAHEINNPVNFIYGNLAYATRYTKDLLELLELYQTATPEPEPEIQTKSEAMDLPFIMGDLPRLMASMRVGAERICEIVRSLQNFSRLDEAELKLVDVHEGIDSTLMILQHRTKAEANRPAIQIIKDYGELPQIKCSAGQLNQVFMNIFSNAIDALEENLKYVILNSDLDHADETTPSRGRNPIKLKTNNHKVKTHFTPTITIRTQVCNESHVSVSIKDNGPGMTQEVLQRVFDPFFTTKEIGKGTGLGMSISHQIVVERHGGQIRCQSTPGDGAEFIIELPIQPSTAK
ncbi:MAG: PAS domain S-box protein [Oculatellaceae cyanobacterium bins.114]|nr:PAS domain S-box protein [Oculatellaceae cyanobacterium bins.114]